MAIKIQAVGGTQDFLPEQSRTWRHIEMKIHQLMSTYNYQEIRTPIFEYTDLFTRGIGELTDIVSKEMYTFQDSGERSLTLRPENTASVVRAVIEHNLLRGQSLLKLYYIGPMFRRERPQKGRYRQFHQFGVEAIGVKSANLDAEIIIMAMKLFEKLGLKAIKLKLNCVGGAQVREQFKSALHSYVLPRLHDYCDDCKKRIETNPLRVLDCKIDYSRNLNAPHIMDFLDDDTKEYFNSICQYIHSAGFLYEIDHLLVRGLDYYTDMVFEISSNDLGSQSAICGGGRYDTLFSDLGSESTPSVGFAIGLERVTLLLEKLGIRFDDDDLDLYIACLDSVSRNFGSKWIVQLRDAGIKTDMDFSGRSLKSQIKHADKLKAKFVIVIGENEMQNRVIQLKNMRNGNETTLTMDDLIPNLLSV